jgi:hypothetical protein
MVLSLSRESGVQGVSCKTLLPWVPAFSGMTN